MARGSRTQILMVIGALIIGMLVGAWLGAGGSALWWLVVALGIIGVAVGIASSVIGKGRKVTDKPLAEV
jgi:hypothetical protein